jgi:hypothetical protein
LMRKMLTTSVFQWPEERRIKNGGGPPIGSNLPWSNISAIH